MTKPRKPRGFLASSDGLKKLLEARKAKKYSNDKIAELCAELSNGKEVKPNQVDRLFSPHWGYNVGLETIERITKVLELSLEDVIGDKWNSPVIVPELGPISEDSNESTGLDDNDLSYLAQEILIYSQCEERPVVEYEDNEQSRQNIRELCDNAFHESGMYEIIRELIGDPFGAYILAYININTDKSIPITVVITNDEPKKEYLINLAVKRVVESNETKVDEDIHNSEQDDTHFGQWLLKHPPIFYKIPPLGVLAIFNKSGEQFKDLSKEDSNFSKLPAFKSSHKRPPLAYAIEVPGNYTLNSIEKGDLPLANSLGKNVVEGRDSEALYRKAMNKWAEVVATTDYLGQDRKISEVFFIPILLNPRINLLLMPTDKVKIPRGLAGLLLLRRCAELLHSKIVESLLKGDSKK